MKEILSIDVALMFALSLGACRIASIRSRVEVLSKSKKRGFSDALSEAKSAKEKAVEIISSLGMTVPEASKG